MVDIGVKLRRNKPELFGAIFYVPLFRDGIYHFLRNDGRMNDAGAYGVDRNVLFLMTVRG